MRKFVLVPDAAQYTLTHGLRAVSATPEYGGAARLRRGLDGAPALVTAYWTVYQPDYRYFRAMYRTGTSNGSMPFLIDLVIDDSEMRTYKAWFVPKSTSLSAVEGNALQITCQLEVYPYEVT